MTHGPALDHDTILGQFEALADELARRGAHAEVFVVGGAATSLAFDNRRVTADVDAAFKPSRQVRAAAAVVGAAHGLDPDWLNDGAKGFMPGNDNDQTVLLDRPSLTVRLASPAYLLAMKICAARPAFDTDDMATLYRTLGYTTVEEGVAIVERFYPSGHPLIPAAARYILADVVERLAQDPGQ